MLVHVVTRQTSNSSSIPSNSLFCNRTAVLTSTDTCNHEDSASTLHVERVTCLPHLTVSALVTTDKMPAKRKSAA